MAKTSSQITQYCIAGAFYQEKFSPISTSVFVDKLLSVNFLSCVNDYSENMATFTALVKIYSTEYFCNTEVAGLGKIFVQQKVLAIQYFTRNEGIQYS